MLTYFLYWLTNDSALDDVLKNNPPATATNNIIFVYHNFISYPIIYLLSVSRFFGEAGKNLFVFRNPLGATSVKNFIYKY